MATHSQLPGVVLVRQSSGYLLNNRESKHQKTHFGKAKEISPVMLSQGVQRKLVSKTVTIRPCM